MSAVFSARISFITVSRCRNRASRARRSDRLRCTSRATSPEFREMGWASFYEDVVERRLASGVVMSIDGQPVEPPSRVAARPAPAHRQPRADRTFRRGWTIHLTSSPSLTYPDDITEYRTYS